MRQTQDKAVVLTAVVVPETLEYDLDGDGIIGDGSIYDVTNNENRREFKLVVKMLAIIHLMKLCNKS